MYSEALLKETPLTCPSGVPDVGQLEIIELEGK
jgi:hypothetical protein